MYSLKDKVAIVTGGSRGIGRATAIDLAKNGAKVVICARDQEKLTAVVNEIQAFDGIALALPCNLDSEADIQKVVATTIQTFNRLDILANIGQGYVKEANVPLENLSSDDATYLFTTGPIASLNFMKASFPYLKKNGGAIINISSRYVEFGGANFTAFGMAKASIESLTHMAAEEWGKYGIRTNCIRPIAMKDTTSKVQKTVINTALKKKIPLGYLAEPNDIAPIITFLASDAAHYLNGEVISVDGGLSKHSVTS